jgi:putative membrane-bound dehydrogenase-like protein
MRTLPCRLLFVVAVTVGFAVSSATHVLAAEFKFDDRTFTLPDGYTIDRVAGHDLVERPITCDFDEQGFLYVAESSGSNDPVQKQLADKPHRILRLEDSDGDGKFDKRTVFADKMMLPQGTMWFRGSLYVAAPPSIWKLTDTDGDGVADKREEWFKGKTLTGCANDLHGPYRGRDGWIYWCKGAFAEQTYDLPGKKGWKTRAAHIFRARPDGTGIEPVMTGGMDNPVDVVFTPEGERIFSCTFLQHPSGGKRDGLIHAIYGGVYGKDHSVLDGHPRTGDLMPVMTHLGPAAPCGLHYLESDHLGEDYKGNLLCCQFNLRKVSRHKLIADGATYKTEDTDLLTSEAMDFHPTDVIEDADGSVIVCDTGGWYKLCCPTSQFHRPEALGAIYRIRRTDAKKVDDPRGKKMNWAKMLPEELVLYLDDPRHVVRERAIENLAARPKEADGVIRDVLTTQNGESVAARINAIWACSRSDGDWIRRLSCLGQIDKSPNVRHAALHASAVWRDKDIAEHINWSLLTSEPSERRVAAEAIGRIGGKLSDPGTEKLILTLVDQLDDRAFEHSLTYAVIESENVEAAFLALELGSPHIQRAALFALDGMKSEKLTIDKLMPHLSSSESIVRDTAWNIAEGHSEWAESLAELLEKQLATVGENGLDDAELARRLARFANSERVRRLLIETLRNEKSPEAARRLVLSAMAQSRLKKIPAEWLTELSALLERRQFVAESVEVLRGQAADKKAAAQISELLRSVGENGKNSSEIRLRAFDSLSGEIDNLSPTAFEFVIARLGKDEATLARSSAVAIVARCKLTSEQLATLAEMFTTLGPFDIARLLPLYEKSKDEPAVAASLAAIESSPGAGELSAAALRPFVEALPAALRPRGDKLLQRADANFAMQREKLETLLATLKDTSGDIQRGRAIFHGKKAACASCHAIAYVGGKVGPDLTKVGEIRNQRDLVEAIAFPSASFVRSYEPVQVVTVDGRQVSGLVREDTPAELVLATAADKEERIARDEIETIRPGTVSVMPQGLDQQLSAQELADVVAFLQSCR